MKQNAFLVSLFLISVLGCKKTPVLEASEDVVGDWMHYTSETEAHRLVVSADGKGYMERLVDGTASRATKVREWYLDDNVLAFGKAAFNGEAYEIEDYPQVAWEEIINYYDTVPELARYMILDGLYYVDTE